MIITQNSLKSKGLIGTQHKLRQAIDLIASSFAQEGIFMTGKYTRQQQVNHASISPSQFIGRQRELSLIWNHYQAASEGNAQVMLVSGEPGIGKTRLLDEVGTLATKEGAIVLRGGASEAEGMPPYLPFLEALGRHIQLTPLDQLRTQVAAAPQILATLLPELITRLGDLPISQPLPPEQGRFRLYEAIGAFIEVIGAPYAVVLILDDLQWADTASLDLLCHLARHQSNAHLLVLGAYRECEIEQNPMFARTLAELTRQRVLATVAIGPLSAVETGMLAISKLGVSLNSGVNVLLHAQSEGNPFFTEELLDCWIEEGALVSVQNQWIAVAPLDHALPPSIIGALRQRFTSLSVKSIDHLRVAAIIGRTFDLSLLATVQEQEIEAVEEKLLEAVHAHLVRTDQTGSFTFSHDKIRECLYAEVSTSRRRRLHGLIGHVLEARYEPKQAMGMSHLAELAFHFARSSDRDRGIDYSKLAAEFTLHTYAAEEAVSHYQMALELLLPDDQRRGALLLEAGEAALLAGKEEEAETYFEAANRWLPQGEDQEAVVRAVHGLGRALWWQEKRTEAYTALKQALDLCDNRPSAQVVEVLLDLCVLLTVYMRRQDEGTAYAQQALEMACSLGDLRLEAMARRIAAENLSLHGSDLPSAVQFLECMLTQVEERGDLPEAGECCLNLAVASYWMASVRRSHDVSKHRIALLERSRESYQLRTAYTWRVLLFASQGAWLEAEQAIEQAHPLVDSLVTPMPAAFLRQFQGFLAYQKEDYPTAERELQAALVGQEHQMGFGEIMFYVGLLGFVQATMGKREEASATMAQEERLLDALPEGILATAPLLICLALTAITLNEQARANQLYSPLLVFQGQCYWFLVDRILGMLATARGEWETAVMHLTAAQVTAQREELQPELARTLLARADLELARGGQGSARRAGDLLCQALAVFEELGMAHSAQQVLSRPHALSSEVGSSIRPSLPAHLTQREAEVLKLVVEGKSNRQIAQAMYLSEKTVTNYLTHIFNKTSCENRAAATAFAIRHGLA
jgi:DNA-binding CsgD family transcriptional regulator/tetratricopeptide (TPR) repeat protein